MKRHNHVDRFYCLSPGHKEVISFEQDTTIEVTSSGKFKTVLISNGEEIRIGFGNYSTDRVGKVKYGQTLEIISQGNTLVDFYVNHIIEEMPNEV